jgi:putative ABC transport system ATP-binding protein
VSTITVESLVKVYSAERADLAVRAVDGISFTVERGEGVAIIGPSGCGKSSLLNILGCLDRPTGGTYLLEGKNIKDMDDNALAEVRNDYVGFVFQSFNLLPRMSALENVELPVLYSRGKKASNKGKKPRVRALEALDRVGLADRAHHLPSELSGGQKQRVAIARALVTEPAMLLCDEPTGALDSRTGREVLELLETLNRAGTTLVMVTHDLGIARHMKRAIILRDGKIIADGPSGPTVDQFVTLFEREAAA